MTKVLVTGAGGFAGHHFLEHVLRTTDWEIIATDSFRHKGKTDRISEVLESNDRFATRRPWWCERTRVITHDLTTQFSRQAIEQMGEIDYMVAYASESHVDRSITDPVPFVQNNTNVALSTLELARKLRPKALVWVSTDEVYGPVEAMDMNGHKEWSAILPSNPYSASKAAQEALAISYWRTYGVPVVIVNCMNMIGERQDPEKFIPLVLNKVIKGETVSIHAQDELHIGTRHYLHARNLADGIVFLLNGIKPRQFGDVINRGWEIPVDRPDRYNIASPDRIDNLTIAKMVAGYANKQLNYKLVDFHSQRPGHDPHYGLDPSKMEALGWTPPISLETSLEHTVDWTLRNPKWLLDD